MNGLIRAAIGLVLAASGTSAFVGLTEAGDPTDPTEPTVDTTVTTTDTSTTDTDTDTDTTTEGDDNANEASEPGRGFSAAKKAWIGCVQDAHALHKEGAKARRAAGEDRVAFDREASCGEKPHPRDFGLGGADDDDDATGEDEAETDDDSSASGRAERGKANKGKGKGHGEDD